MCMGNQALLRECDEKGVPSGGGVGACELSMRLAQAAVWQHMRLNALEAEVRRVVPSVLLPMGSESPKDRGTLVVALMGASWGQGQSPLR